MPAALIGVDIHRLLDRARTVAEACAFSVPETANPCLALGAALGELARQRPQYALTHHSRNATRGGPHVSRQTYRGSGNEWAQVGTPRRGLGGLDDSRC